MDRVDCFLQGILQQELGKQQRGSAGLYSPLSTLGLDPSHLPEEQIVQGCQKGPPERHKDRLSTPQKAIWLSGVDSWSWEMLQL